jgi:predicted helicase
MGRPRDGIMKHLLNENIAILTCRQQRTSYFRHVFISKNISERCLVSLQTGEVNYVFPIYLYTEDAKNKESTYIRESNINESYIIKFSEKVKLTYNADNKSTKESFTLVELFEYIYAILHSPTYRAKYKEFLKIDFPRIPYPKDQATFWQFVKLGGELRQIHLLESPIVERFITSYPVTGNNEVGKVRYEDGKVRINESQYFDHVPQVAWEFYIGGYQPAQKWLKDRKGRQLSFEDVRHYQKIIVALTETDRIMREIDKAEFE